MWPCNIYPMVIDVFNLYPITNILMGGASQGHEKAYWCFLSHWDHCNVYLYDKKGDESIVKKEKLLKNGKLKGPPT